VPEDPAGLYILHGEDEFSLALFLSEIQAGLGDAALSGINIDRVDGRSSTLEDLRLIVGALPLFVSSRMVIVTDLLPAIEAAGSQGKFIALLESLPKTTVLILVEQLTLKEGHWLLAWVAKSDRLTVVQSFPKLKGDRLTRWIEVQTIRLGGKISRRAAASLASLVGDNTRLAYNELEKLLAYVGYQRRIDVEDIDLLVVSISQADIFELVDAIGNRNNRRALAILGKLTKTKDRMQIFYMIVRQIRLVLLAKEVLALGNNDRDVAHILHLHPYVAGKVSDQAKKFSREDLKIIYRWLLRIDGEVKTGNQEWEVAMESLVVEIR